MATAAVTTMAVTAPSILSAPAPAGGNQVAVVEIRDDDVPLPAWGQWESLPAPAPEPPVVVLMMREDGCVMSGSPAHGAEVSSSRAPPPASDGTAVRPEQERERINAPPANFTSAQTEQALWQEFRNHGASLNRALNKALQIHGGPAWRVFQVCDFSPDFVVFPPLFLPRLRSPNPCPLSLCPPVEGFGGSGPGEVQRSRSAGRRA
jgi:hypothetical protein